jgi:hypothetical protein
MSGSYNHAWTTRSETPHTCVSEISRHAGGLDFARPTSSAAQRELARERLSRVAVGSLSAELR